MIENEWMDVFSSACTLDKVQVQEINLWPATLCGYVFSLKIELALFYF